MANILSITEALKRAGPAKKTGADGEIVFFPGVRYEWVEDESRLAEDKRSDKLELAASPNKVTS